MTTQDHILVVDDDPEIRQLLQTYLERNGLQVTGVGEGSAMWEILDRARIDLIVLDIMLPGVDGLELCRQLRARTRTPIIMLTARGDELDRILGLELGADDYLAKPFSARELLARIKVVLRRARELPLDPLLDASPGMLVFEGWTLDTRTQTLTSPAGVLVSLSQAEYRLLHVLLTHPNRALTRDQLLDLTQGRESAAPSIAVSTCSSAGCVAVWATMPRSRVSSRHCAGAAICWRRASSLGSSGILPCASCPLHSSVASPWCCWSVWWPPNCSPRPSCCATADRSSISPCRRASWSARWGS